jgi:hypothetical protein
MKRHLFVTLTGALVLAVLSTPVARGSAFSGEEFSAPGGMGGGMAGNWFESSGGYGFANPDLLTGQPWGTECCNFNLVEVLFNYTGATTVTGVYIQAPSTAAPTAASAPNCTLSSTALSGGTADFFCTSSSSDFNTSETPYNLWLYTTGGLSNITNSVIHVGDSAVPEPATSALGILGLTAIIAARRRFSR